MAKFCAEISVDLPFLSWV